MNSLHDCKKHYGEQLNVGPYTIWAGGVLLQPECLGKVDVLVTLAEYTPDEYEGVSFPNVHVHWLRLPDFGGVPDDWSERVQEVVHLLEEGKKIAAHCHGGFGRTGTLLASLVAVLESAEETPDPIKAVRERYCPGAVETRLQAEAVFALREQPLPYEYLALR